MMISASGQPTPTAPTIIIMNVTRAESTVLSARTSRADMSLRLTSPHGHLPAALKVNDLKTQIVRTGVIELAAERPLSEHEQFKTGLKSLRES